LVKGKWTWNYNNAIHDSGKCIARKILWIKNFTVFIVYNNYVKIIIFVFGNRFAHSPKAVGVGFMI